MAKKLIVELLLKAEIPAKSLEELKEMIFLKLKAKVMKEKEKEKGKKLMWLLVAAKPEGVTEETLMILFKRLKLSKVVRRIDISAG